MKTMEELYKEVMASKELQAELMEAAKTSEGFAEWLKKHDCNATIEEVAAFISNQTEGEISDNDVADVAGGSKEEAKKFFGDLGETMRRMFFGKAL